VLLEELTNRCDDVVDNGPSYFEVSKLLEMLVGTNTIDVSGIVIVLAVRWVDDNPSVLDDENT
jgi:hypothetical protein